MYLTQLFTELWPLLLYRKVGGGCFVFVCLNVKSHK